MTLERGVSPTGLGEVLVTVTGDAEVAGGATSVKLTCRDARDGWSPRLATRGRCRRTARTLNPTSTSRRRRRELGRIERCVLGTRPAMAATLPLR